jgi:hypothetical protein
VIVAGEAFTKFTFQKDIAEYMKKQADLNPELNAVTGKGPWNCIVGRSFAGAVAHEREFIVLLDLPTYDQKVLSIT